MTESGGVLGRLARRLSAGDKLLAGWAVLGVPDVAELMVRNGFDTVVLDMQHGAYTVETATRAIVSLALVGAPAIVRIPVGDFATASRMFDAGAAAVIAPMINSVADATAFAQYAKYSPLGERSWGPGRAVPLTGLASGDYFRAANAMQLAMPMIETRAALDALDDILAVPGIDGVFVGPSDLSIALTGGRLDPMGPEIARAIDHVLARTRAAAKSASLFCVSGTQAKAMLARGFALCSVATDAGLLGTAAAAEVAAGR